MTSFSDAFRFYSLNQQRELKTAVIAVTLGATMQAAAPALVRGMKLSVKRKMGPLTEKKELTEQEKKYLELLSKLDKISTDLEGLRQLENLRTDPLGKELFTEFCTLIPSQHSCFGVFLQVPNSLSRFAEFMTTRWHYSGSGYAKPPRGFSEPFSGFDTIVNSLMGHPSCRAEVNKQIAGWEKWQKANNKKAA